jgi:hypothetical protein
MRLTFLLILLLWSAMWVGHAAADSSRTSHVSAGAGLLSAAVIDEGYSPLQFSGTQGALNIGYARATQSKENLLRFGYSAGTLQNRHGRNLETLTVDFLVAALYRWDDSPFSVGWAQGNQFHSRTIDDFLNFTGRADYFSAIGPAAQYATPLQFANQRLSFRALGHVQVFGFYIPSGYVSSLPKGFGYEQSGFLKSVYRSAFLFHPGSAVHIGVTPELQWQIGENSRLGLGYAYNYSTFRQIHPSTFSHGNYLLSLQVGL